MRMTLAECSHCKCRYIDDPVLINGHKFHLRVYVLCVGALQVYSFDKILLLLAGHKYDQFDTADMYKHLTNTARSAEIPDFNEADFVKVKSKLYATESY